MKSTNKQSGRSTLQYKAIRKNYYHIVLNLEQVLTKITTLCFEKEIISTTERDDPRQPLYDQSAALLRKILSKVELDQKWYDVFLTVLDEFPELSDIKDSIESSYASEEGSQFASLPRRRSPRLEEINRRHSESLPRGCPRLEESSRRHSETHSKSVHPTGHLTDLDLGVSWVTINSNSQNDENVEFPSDDGLLNKDRITDSKYLQEKIKKLRQTVKEQSKIIEDLGGKVYERDTVIENLKKELNGKDDIVKELEKDAKIELQNVKFDLVTRTAMLEKEKDLGQLREKFRIEEKAKMKLKILLEEEKTQRAQEATEHALRDLERKAKKERAQHARDESEDTKGFLKVERDLREKADKERILSDVQIKKEVQDRSNEPIIFTIRPLKINY